MGRPRNEMTVVAEDNCTIVFRKERGVVRTVIYDGCILSFVQVNESSIIAKIGKPLEFDYYNGYGNCNHASTETPVKEITGKLY